MFCNLCSSPKQKNFCCFMDKNKTKINKIYWRINFPKALSNLNSYFTLLGDLLLRLPNGIMLLYCAKLGNGPFKTELVRIGPPKNRGKGVISGQSKSPNAHPKILL